MRIKLFICVFLIFPFIGFSQIDENWSLDGKWEGFIYGGGLPKQKITLIIKSIDNSEELKAYYLSSAGKKIRLSGRMRMEDTYNWDTPITLYESKENSKNGYFELTNGVIENEDFGMDYDIYAGNWTSYDKRVKRKVKLYKR